MSDHEEQIITGYRPDLIRRIWEYARPHSHLLILAVICLVVSTITEVLVPVIIQRTVDHQILDYRVRIRSDATDDIPDDAIIASTDQWRYFREDDLSHLSLSRRKELEDSGILDTNRYVMIPPDRLPEGIAEIDHGDGFIVIRRTALESLPEMQRLNLQGDKIDAITRTAYLYLGILVVGLIGSFGQVYVTAYTGQRIMRDLRIRLFSHTTTRSLAFLNHQPVGRLVTRVTNDVETINELFTSVLAELLRNVSLMIAVITALFAIHPRLAMFVLISVVPVAAITDIFRRRSRTAFRRVRRAVSTVNSYLSEYISGMSVVQMFVQQERSRTEFGEKNDELLRANLNDMYVFAVFRPVVDLLSTVSISVVLFFGARMLDQNLISIGVLIAFTNLIRRFYQPVMSISEQFTVLQSALAGSERVFELMDESARIEEPSDAATIPERIDGTIRFSGVDFAYKKDEPVIRNLSFDVEPGQLVAIVGYTGAGKTTIINLLTRLWDIDGGSIEIDGIPIEHWPLERLRSTVQPIQQDVYLFNDTIRDNITLGLDADDESIWNACEAVQAAPFIRALPDGLDTVLTERGGNLSMGQRQLISFARVLVHDPPVLVLDEATSSIDSETEQRLQRAVEVVTGGRTSLVIAHRLSTIQHADRILVLSHGELAETGTHQELLDADGVYATLYQLQFAGGHSSQ